MTTNHNKCPRCGSFMVEKPPTQIYCSNPPQWDSVMWCGCGHTESRGRVYGRTPEQSLRDEWESINRDTLISCPYRPIP